MTMRTSCLASKGRIVLESPFNPASSAKLPSFPFQLAPTT